MATMQNEELCLSLPPIYVF